MAPRARSAMSVRYARWLEPRRRAADRGSARAAVRLVEDLLARPDRRRHLDDARHYARIAMRHRDPFEADVIAGLFLYADGEGGWRRPRGDGVDPAFAIRSMRELASRGNVHAMHSLYLVHLRGAGLRRDLRVAERWARRAARHGDGEPLNNLGVAYFHGEGVRRDVAHAVRCYRSAIRITHDAHALRNLAKCFEHGDGVRRNDRESVRLLKRAVRANARLPRDSDSCSSCAWRDLGWRLARGEGVRKDQRRGIALIRRAARTGEPGAIEMLEELGLDVPPRTIPRSLRRLLRKSRSTT